MTAEMYVPKFFVKQKLTMMVNRYEIRVANPDGTEGAVMAVAQQKRMAFKEQVTFFADESRTQPVFGFKARKKIDLNAGYDVTDANGQPIGFFRKDFKASFFNSTFHIEGPGFGGTGSERSQLVAVLRRFSDIPFLRFHFDFNDDDGKPLMSSERKGSLRDKYTVTVHDDRVDFRIAAAMAVGLDALMAR
ncbi:hypothetical protein ASG90_04955 [Nocardioides sp. Soil797]|nr:hypothetical protein ASG90_04955 [Nocardioides sp. Soil797]